MAPSRERSSRPTRRNSRNLRPYKPRVSSYSHINIQPAEAESSTPNPPDPTDFVTRPSLQVVIEEDLAYAKKVASTAFRDDSPPGSHPTTFAEAAMSTRVRGTMASSGRDRDGEKQDTLGESRSFETLGILRPTKKRKKAQKWSALDLSAVEDTSEAVGNGNNNGSEAPSPLVLSPTFASTPLPQTQTTPPIPSLDIRNKVEGTHHTTYADKGKEAVREQAYFLPEARPEFILDPSAEAPSIYHNTLHNATPLDTNGDNLNDTPETKRNFETIMAHLNQYVAAPVSNTFPGQDAFDSITWDPDLPEGSSQVDKSPEKIAPKPKPVVAYTTVGSVVNPNNVPQFSAPNRIQREGAGRRPLMAMSNRQYDSLLQPRGPIPPSLNMQPSMQYSQHLQLIPATYGAPRQRAHTPVLNQLPPSVLQLTDQERLVLGKLEEAIQKIPLNARKTVSTAPSSSSSSVGGFGTRILLNDEDVKRAYGIQGMRQGLEKMQTLQRLAKFENPMRQHALSRLSEFSVMAQAASKKNSQEEILEAMLRGHQMAESTSQGELNQRFQFPPPGSATAAANPLYGAYRSSNFNNSAPPSRPPGYPKPLTAGPPGQRQANQAFLSARMPNLGMPNTDFSNNFLSMTRQSSGYTTYSNSEYPLQVAQTTGNDAYVGVQVGQEQNTNEYLPPYSSANPFRQSTWPTNLQFQQKTTSSCMDEPISAPINQGPHTILYDTIPADMMTKYYPNGAPAARGYHRAMEKSVELDILALEEETTPDTHELARRKVEVDEFFYYGQRRYFMTGEDHVVELESRETHPFGAIEPPHRGSIVPPLLAPEVVEEMSLAEAFRPAIDGLFGTLLSYAESSDRSRTKLSGWVTGPPDYVDDSVQGNKSCFGEDWGNTGTT